MLIISLIFGALAPFLELVYVLDWWHPLTITNTLIGIEDFLFGFTVPGIASSIYEILLNKRLRLRRSSKKEQKLQNSRIFTILVFMIFLFLIGFYLLGISSFYASVVGFSVGIVFIFVSRPDLILDSVVSGFLVTLVAMANFILGEAIAPGVVKALWYNEIFSGTLILGVPIEDLIWFFLGGMFFGPIYEFWKEARLHNL